MGYAAIVVSSIIGIIFYSLFPKTQIDFLKDLTQKVSVTQETISVISDINVAGDIKLGDGNLIDSIDLSKFVTETNDYLNYLENYKIDSADETPVNYDDLYYQKSEVDTKLKKYLQLTGGTLTGGLVGTTAGFTSLTGTLTGNVIGNVTGDVSGSAGGLTGNPAITIGGFTLPTGASLNYVLTSDANGKATWSNTLIELNASFVSHNHDTRYYSQTQTTNLLNSYLRLTGGTLTGDLLGTQATFTTFTGNLIGNVTGDVAGDVTGDLTGNVIGNVTGIHTGNVVGNVAGNASGTAGGLSGSPSITVGGITMPTSAGSGYLLTSDANGVGTWQANSPTLPAGTEGQTLYNNAGAWATNSGLFYDDTNNRVGIGTTSPGAKLHIVQNDNQLLYLESTITSGSDRGAGFISYSNDGVALAAGDRLGYNLFGGYDGTILRNAAGITAFTEDTWSSGVFPAYLRFETTQAGTRTEKMRITGAGNVGIGTTAPDAVLEVLKDTTAETKFQLTNPNAGTGAFSSIVLHNATNYGSLNFFGSGFTSGGTAYQNGLRLWTDGAGGISFAAGHSQAPIRFFSGGVSTSSVIINTLGNVGIGSTSPENHLVVGVGSANGQSIALQDASNTKIVTGTGIRSDTSYDSNFDALGGIRMNLDADNNSTNDFRVIDGTNNIRLLIQEDGNVGVGTTVPNAKLQVNGTADTSQLIVQANATQSNTNPLVALKNSSGTIISGFHSDRDTNIFLGVNSGRSNSTGANNIFMGKNAGYSNTSGASNIGIGSQTLNDNQTTSNNIAIGLNALQYTLRENNVAIGSNSGSQLGNSYDNILIGSQAGRGNSASQAIYGNVLIGVEAGKDVISGSSKSVMVGYKTGLSISSGKENILLGYQAGDNLSTGSDNIILGYDIDAPIATGSNQMSIGNLIYATGVNGTGTTPSTGNVGIGTTAPGARVEIKGASDISQLIVRANATQSNTNPLILLQKSDGTTFFGISSDHDTNTFIGLNSGRVNNQAGGGWSNTFVGSAAGYSNTAGTYNVALGSQALYSNSNGGSNIAIGHQALRANSTTGNNTAIGYTALRSTTAGNNTAFGYGAGYSNSTGSGNIFIGYSAGYSETASNKLYIENSNSASPLIWGDFNTDVVNINGSLGIGTTAPGSALDVKGTLRLSGATSGYIGLAPAAAAGSTTYTLPSADGVSGQVLSTNGSAVLSWTSAVGFANPMTGTGDLITQTTSGNANQALVDPFGATATAYHVSSGVANNAIDGDDGTSVAFWSNDSGQWLRVDLGSAKTIAAYRLKKATNLTGFRLWYSTNDTDWVAADEAKSNAQADVTFTLPVQISARYWKLNIDVQDWSALYTMELRTPVVTSPQALAIGSTNQVLAVTGGMPVWSNLVTVIGAIGNVGIGTTNPTQALEVNGGIRQNTVTAKPTCDATTRGTTWFAQGAAGVKDSYEVCAKDAGDAYSWRTIY